MFIKFSKKLPFFPLLVIILILNLNQFSVLNQNLFDERICSYPKSDNEKKYCDLKCLIDRDSSLVELFSLNSFKFINLFNLVFIFLEINNFIELKNNSPPKIYFFNRI